MPDVKDGDFPVVIGTIEKNSRETIRIAVDEYKDHRYLDIRIFAKGDEGPRATKSGVTLRLDRISQLRGLLEQAETAARERGLA